MIDSGFVALGLKNFVFERITNTHIVIPVIVIIKMMTPLIVPPIMAPVDPVLLELLPIVVASKLMKKNCLLAHYLMGYKREADSPIFLFTNNFLKLNKMPFIWLNNVNPK